MQTHKTVVPVLLALYPSELTSFVNVINTDVCCLTQISMSVQQTMEDVALKPAALTRWAALHVPVYQDTPEMDLVVQVSHTE